MNLGLRLQSWFIRAFVFALVCTDAGLAHAQVAAKVTHITGTVVETDAAGRSRTLAADSSVAAGARLSTASDSYAHLKFGDGTDLYLRSNTEYVIEKYQFTEQKPAEDGFVTRLLKGGFRQVTGLLGRRSPAAVRIAAKTSTIGIRGTDFGVRICETTCVGDTDTRSRITPAESPIARINSLQGTAIAVEALSERERQLADGAALYRGDVVATGEGGQIAFFFRDGTRISLAENSVLAIEDFAYNATDPASGRATLVQYLGGARVWTGAIGKASPEHFVYRTPNTVITPQGSWWDVVVSTAQAVSGAVASGAQAVGGAVESAAQAVGGAAASGAQAVGGAAASGAQAVGGAVASGAQAVGRGVASGAQSVGRGVASGAQAVGGAAQQTGQAIHRAVQQTAQAIQGAAHATGQAVRGAAQQTGQAIQGAAQATGQAVQPTAQQAAQIVGGAAPQGGPLVQGTPPPTPAAQSGIQQSGQAVEDPRSESANQRRQQDEENQRRAAEDQRRQQDEQRKADEDAKRKADEDRRRQQDEQRKADEDAKRKADEDRRRAEDDQRRQQDAQRKADEDAKRKADEDRRKVEDAQRKADEDRKRAAEDQRKQQEEQRKQADEERKKLETHVTVQEGAVIVTSQQGSQRIDPSSTGLQVIADGRLEPLPGRVEVHAPDPSTVSADPIRAFGEAGGTKADAGVYVTVFDGAVSLKQADVEIVLVKGETGFADAKNSAPQLLDSPPPILRHDLLLGNAALGSQSCPP